MATAFEQLKGIGDLLTVGNTLFGKQGAKQTQTSSGYRQTVGQDIAPEGLQRIIDQMMAGRGGVKDVSGAARGAGLYNSTTEAQMRNDLAARVAGEAAARSAKTVTDVSPSTVTTIATPEGGIDPMQGLLTIGGLKLAGGLIDKATDGGSLLDMLPDFGSIFGGGEAAPAVGAVSQVGSIGSGGSLGFTGSGSLGLGGAGASTALSSLGSGLSTGGGLGFTGTGGLGLGSLGASPAASLGGGTLGLGSDFAAASSMLNDPSTLFTSGLGAGGDLGAVGLGNVGGAFDIGSLAPFASPVMSLLGGILGGKDALNPLSLGLSSISGGMALAPMLGPLAPLGFLAGPLAGGLGSLFGDSVICTALKKRGLLDPVEYALGEEYLRSLSSYTVTGYYIWGLKVAKAIDNGNPWAIAISLPWAHSRMKLLADRRKWTKWIHHPLGTITQFIGQPLCWLLGLAVSLTGGASYGRVR